MKEEIRVKIDKDLQRRIFSDFIKRFNKDFKKASDYLNIPRSSLSKYKRTITRYLPEKILIKVTNYLEIKKPKITEKGTLKEIRKNYIHKAHPILKQKYGKNWAKELTKRRDFKGISLEDFPDNTFIYLEGNYRKKLLETAYNLAGSLKKLSKLIKISQGGLSYWHKGKQKDHKTNKIGLQFIPIKKLKLISLLLVEDNNHEFSMKNIEKNIIMYRMQAGNPVKNPKFPIKESSELTKLLFHLLGDGYCGNNKNCANYRNTSQELLEEFKKDLQIFGDVPIYEQKYSIKFPRLIADIIKKFYGVNPMCFESEISKKIKELPKKYLYQGIKAFADDEGSIYPCSVRLTSGNDELLKGISEILDYLKLKHGDIKNQKNERAKKGMTFYLDIKDLKKYHRYIGFSHPIKKKKLEEYIKKKRTKHRKKELKS